MPAISQFKRDFRISTPLGGDTLLVEKFVGEEATSRPFLFTIDLLSEDRDVNSDRLLGQSATLFLSVTTDGKTFERPVNGIVRSFMRLGSSGALYRYRIELVPWLWLATLRTDIRSFQGKSVPEIVKAVLEPYSSSIHDTLTVKYPSRDYCVQYQESDFDFVSRLMEEEGIYYSFTHTEYSVDMVLADSPTTLAAAWAPKALVRQGQPDLQDRVYEWSTEHSMRSEKVTVSTYEFQTPSTTKLHSEGNASEKGALERYEYLPSYDSTSATGQRQAAVRLDAYESYTWRLRGASTVRSLQAGAQVSMHDDTSDGPKSVLGDVHLLRVKHEGRNAMMRASAAEESSYANEFEGVPADTKYRPPRVTPRPRVAGVHTAVVVGPSGQEIFVDKFGRVKLQFHWDRLGKKDDKSSAWVRVSSTWAGKGWGFLAHPRIGQEVLVEYVDGDPDQPVVTGRVYNADMPLPYATDSSTTQTGIRSRSTKQGGADEFNELRFDDKKGSEEVSFQAQKDLKSIVKNDETRDVGHDRTTTIKNNETRTVSEGNDTLTVSKGDQSVTIAEGDQTITVTEGDQTTAIKAGDQTVTVKGKQTVTVTGNVTHEVKTGNYALAVDTGNHGVKVKTGNHAFEVSTGNAETKVSMGNLTTTVSLGNVVQKAGVGKQTFEAMQGIELKVGANSIVIDQSGVTIKGLKVAVEGQVQTEVKGLMVTLEGSAMATIKGGVTMIN